jgi:imidazolonepropionase
LHLLAGARIFTAGPVGTIPRGSVLLDGERIAWIGAGDPPASPDATTDLGGALVTPGLIDAHTHPVYAVPRLEEIALRSRGAGYAEVAASGGGIAATVRSTRAADREDLRAAVRRRLRSWLDGGGTTVEVKTGYHLQREGELWAVSMLAELAADPELPRLAVTLLAAHATPPDRPGERAEYAAEAAAWSRDAKSAGAEFCDAFCDDGYFTVAEARAVLSAGQAAGLKARIHADELARTGGSRLAAELRATSADHLLRITADDARALAAAGVVATLAPATALSLGVTPPVRELLAAGCTLALGSDHNPGTSGITSMALVVSLAVAALGLSVDQALTAATAGGAASIAAGGRGRLEAGRAADLVVWETEHEGAFAWEFGPRPAQVWVRGVRAL